MNSVLLFLVVLTAFWSDDVLAFGPGGGSIVRRASPISYREEMTSETARPVTCGGGARSMTMMPIGIPKVAYRMPGSRGGEWVDIYQRLTRERIIFMGGEIDDEMANQIIGVLLVSCIPVGLLAGSLFFSHLFFMSSFFNPELTPLFPTIRHGVIRQYFIN